jgi:UDP-N-acetylmuramyl pentapeptide phosphotransferase/UDP-N-acetylglucosamine-1-phosphate transferase
VGLGYWRIVVLPVIGEVSLGSVGIPVTFLWIVGLINATNFMDGIDGITGAQAIIATSSWAVVGWLMRDQTVTTLSILLASSSLGFLVHNWPPARVFMGDVGSAFLGYSLSVLPLLIAPAPTWSAMTAILLVWPFLFDTGFTFLRRLSRAENVFAAHRSHLYQRLIAAGYAHRPVTLLYIGLAVMSGLLALAWSCGIALRDGTVILGSLLISGILWSLVWQGERRWTGRQL